MEKKTTADKVSWMINITTLALLLLSFAAIFNMARQIVSLMFVAAGM